MPDLKKPRLCLMYTGGTIGMHRDKNGVLSPPTDPQSFLSIAPQLNDVADFDFVPLMNKDSTNMHPCDWVIIAQAVYNRRNEGYNGIVIAHGTDTMHFSASAVALALGKNLNFPVVFTGAQTAPDIQHGDARVNLYRAFKVAVENIAEVVICFGDYVFRGCRAQKKDERRFDAFESPAFFPLANITEEILINDSIAFSREQKSKEIELKNEFCSHIFQVSLIPGLEPELLDGLLTKDICNGIVLQSFGAGNVPHKEKYENYSPYSWLSFIEKASKDGMPVLITSQFPANATLHTAYAPGVASIEAGAIPTGNMTSACATAKFRWVLAHDEIKGLSGKEKLGKIREMMNIPYIGELDLKQRK